MADVHDFLPPLIEVETAIASIPTASACGIRYEIKRERDGQTILCSATTYRPSSWPTIV
ncbi:hypothetical protein BURKHO8Y_250030 [Burkholderia sp. 8Y]|nr:hypothetical protein BURKHO8Y_250030 [Burkholderia sp. 8Y]